VSARVLQSTATRLRRRLSAVLCYHGVGTTGGRVDPGYLRVRPDAFRQQLELLLGAGFRFVTVSELTEHGPPPPGLVALTFDDGMDDNHAVVLPLLTELGLRATVYVATGLIGKPNPWLGPAADGRMMNAAELRDLVAAGFEIGAHTVTHPDLSTLDYDNCLREVTESRDALRQLLGVDVRTFAYPYCRYGDAAVAAVRDAGFATAVTCHGRGSWSMLELKRSFISGKDKLPIFVLKLTDAYQPLFDSIPGRLGRAATRRVRDRLRERRAGT
jgi:peptidoglycan/xylan/chitin deacetylase (PgdA/CDA1 family)